jgi:Grx4 family monothiol glutaredoxin
LATDVTKPEPASQGLAGGTAVLEVLKKELPPASDTPPTVNGIALKDSLPEVEKSELHKLVNSNPIMLFMKGTPEEPKCGFSRKVVAALKDEGVQFDSFNVLSDETVRQGIKTFSNWPTFPQLYVMGELLGGCDIVLEMHKSGELKQVFEEKGLSHTGAVPNDTPEQVVPETVPAVPLVESAATENAPPSGDDELKARIQHLVNKSPIVLFMKGTPQDPRCKFSRKVVQALGEEGVVYGSFDILSDESVRQGLKEYSNWPTYPQLYVNGEFIGGCDIILEMHQNGELKEVRLLP